MAGLSAQQQNMDGHGYEAVSSIASHMLESGMANEGQVAKATSSHRIDGNQDFLAGSQNRAALAAMGIASEAQLAQAATSHRINGGEELNTGKQTLNALVDLGIATREQTERMPQGVAKSAPQGPVKTGKEATTQQVGEDMHDEAMSLKNGAGKSGTQTIAEALQQAREVAAPARNIQSGKQEGSFASKVNTNPGKGGPSM